MSSNIFVIAEHLDGVVTETTFELLALGRGLAADTGGLVEAGLVGSGVAALAGELGGADTVVVVDDDALGSFNPDTHAGVFSQLVADRNPQIVLVPYTSMGMDVASHIAIATDLPLVSYCKAVSASGSLQATCSLYAGKLDADVEVDGDRAIFAVLSGAASPDAGRSGGTGDVEAVSPAVDPSGSPVGFLGLTHPEGGDVDITAQDVLVVVGRGIGDEDSIEEAQEVADALGGAVAASRPIVDQGWLPKSRQVGKSGLSVKPKVYLALGVSGAPEHVEGMRDASTIIAVNTDPAAPIFGMAHYGWVGDLFDLLPELTDLLED